MIAKARADELVCQQGLADSREQARRLMTGGQGGPGSAPGRAGAHARSRAQTRPSLPPRHPFRPGGAGTLRQPGGVQAADGPRPFRAGRDGLCLPGCRGLHGGLHRLSASTRGDAGVCRGRGPRPTARTTAGRPPRHLARGRQSAHRARRSHPRAGGHGDGRRFFHFPDSGIAPLPALAAARRPGRGARSNLSSRWARTRPAKAWYATKPCAGKPWTKFCWPAANAA